MSYRNNAKPNAIQASLQSSKVSGTRYHQCCQSVVKPLAASVKNIYHRNPPSAPKAPTLPLHPHLLSRFCAAISPPRILIPILLFEFERSNSSTPYSLLPRPLPSRPEVELLFVWTRRRLDVLLKRLAKSVKLRRLTDVLLRLLSLASVLPARRVLLLLSLSRRVGTAVLDMERDGNARELGRLPLGRGWDGVVPVRGRRPLDPEFPWNADMA